jgi:hypothetical protein
VGVASGADAGRALGSGTAADIGKADAVTVEGAAGSAIAITFGRWRGSGIRPVSGATVGKSALAPSLVAWSCPEGAAAIVPGGIAGGLVVGLGQAKLDGGAAAA